MKQVNFSFVNSLLLSYKKDGKTQNLCTIYTSNCTTVFFCEVCNDVRKGLILFSMLTHSSGTAVFCCPLVFSEKYDSRYQSLFSDSRFLLFPYISDILLVITLQLWNFYRIHAEEDKVWLKYCKEETSVLLYAANTFLRNTCGFPLLLYTQKSNRKEKNQSIASKLLLATQRPSAGNVTFQQF